MKLALKILIPIFAAMTIIFAATNSYAITSFQNIFLENKALSLGDHAIRETREVFKDEDLHQKTVTKEVYSKMKEFAKALEDPSVFRVKIWDRNLRIVYSDLKRLENTTNKYEADFIKPAFSEKFPVRWKRESGDESDSESGFGTILEIIVPINDRSGETQYVLEMYSATSAILSVIQDSINQIIYFWILSALVIYSVFYLLVQFMVIRPILRLRKIMEIVGKGDLSAEAKSKSNDDIGILYRNFDEMRAKLKSTFDELASSKSSLEANNSILEEEQKKLAQKVLELERFQKLTMGRELKMIELKKEIEELKKER